MSYSKGQMKEIYLSLMEDLLCEDNINVNDKIYSQNVSDYNHKLQRSCEEFNKIMLEEKEKEKKRVLTEEERNNISFSVGTTVDRLDNLLEPCPIYCPKEANVYKYVFIGLNPYRDKRIKNEESNSFPQHTTNWNDWMNYNFPNDEWKMKKQSIYTHIAYNALGSDKYYDWAFRLHQALFYEDRVYDNWQELEDKASSLNLDMKDYFLNEFWDHPILSAEMIPYKSYTYGVNNKSGVRFVTSIKGYKDYLVNLLRFIDEHTDSDSTIIFLGHSENVVKILWAVKDDISFLPNDCTEKIFGKLYKKSIANAKSGKNNHFYGFYYGDGKSKKRVMISPFLFYHGTRIDLRKNRLIEKIKNGELFRVNEG